MQVAFQNDATTSIGPRRLFGMALRKLGWQVLRALRAEVEVARDLRA
jgi:hypothetical protein